MLNRIEYSLPFPTGKTFSAAVDFRDGLTAVTGRNESGKSLLLEMVRYALFGNKALRGKASDYKKSRVELWFDLKDESYRVLRAGSKAELFRGSEQVATGTKPVNDKVVSLFGYGLEVFDVANACLQGEIERLGSMKPTERKALVDRTIGLDAIDKAFARVGEDLTKARGQVEMLEQDIVVPEAPTKPENYAPSNELREMISHHRGLRDEKVRLSAWIEANPKTDAPKMPSKPENLGDLADLESQAEEYNRNTTRLSEVEELINSTTAPELTRDQIDEQIKKIADHAAYAHDQAKRAQSPASEHTEDELGHIERAQKALEVRAQIEKLRGQDQHECPNCEFTWNDNDEIIEQLQREIPLYDDEKLPKNWEFIDVTVERRRNKSHELMLASLSGAEPCDEPEWNNAQLERMNKQWEAYDALSDLRAERRKLHSETSEDPTEALQIARDYFSAELRWQREFEEWQERSQKFEANNTLLAKVEEEYIGEIAYNELLPRLEEAVGYESRLNHYNEARKAFAEQEERLEDKRAQVTDLENARKALRDLKAKIKNYLLPSLNTVASVLLTKMTGGERNEIRVDEDFEILVDGQPLNTLSGSGKAVANLAIRLGLGQVLTNKTFSVFLADEIDAAMDADRAGYTTDCLTNLTDSISQIVIVSHKTISAQHHIEMGNHNEYSAARAGDGNRGAA